MNISRYKISHAGRKSYAARSMTTAVGIAIALSFVLLSFYAEPGGTIAQASSTSASEVAYLPAKLPPPARSAMPHVEAF